MFQRVLMVCTGNICRSPMAEVVFAQRLRLAGLSAQIESAGIGALVGHSADPMAIELMSERGLDLSRHRARQLTPELLRAFELVLVMETGQQRVVESMHPSARGRVRRVGHFGGFEVPDPYRKPRSAFESTLALIERGLADLEAAFWRTPT